MNAARMILVIGFALAGSFWQALAALWGVSLMRSVARPIFSAWLTQNIDPRVRATVISMSGQADAIGQIAGGPAIGAIGGVSLRAAMAAAGVVLAPSLWLFARARRQGQSGM